ncbi:hypothetical protein CLAFUW4_10184 [Fulvia fulva]|uniref:Zn(2)-C6 fungal-type domain-containing protein n=1 Tax=Passalora fulva TaxID=5499 RepID=A0A9Q8LG06_PASFU|nr:uncharacterized protein CLAFUR5_04797 [Fulvia fulva]KAK4616091.1 hypothetical protein CLAFUR4_10188 [Fulvia fulva]KAK4617087.1 hypothetical protein CLAFUR0_10186 [Fulvia fulva]UJO16744.1 hypothetical protein CLAFUR5_04797 [Fulvia fulva]WPV18956.1 hypothetical protein CLAFUW4_10184 [Fulvia fulva]WPV34505.1 hypothetical protein CLAFUW7_10184 [Fulvia fulva]
MTEPITRRKHKGPRPQISCAVCHRRKVKCDKSLPCAQCIKHGCRDECRFDGLPSKQQVEPETRTLQHVTKNSNHNHQTQASVSHFDIADSASSTQQRTPDQAPPPRAEPSQVARSQFATHDWVPEQSSMRGRTHVSWSLQAFDRLMTYAGISLTENAISQFGNGSSNVPTHESGTSETSVAGLPDRMFDYLPPISTACGLIVRYLETFDTVYPILDREAFEDDTSTLLADPAKASKLFVMKSLLVQAMASATYLSGEASAFGTATPRWREMASSCLTSMIEAGQLSMEGLRLLALGVHHAEDAASRTLWWCINELDLNACLAAGMPPCATATTQPEMRSTQPNAIDTVEDIQHILRASLPTRQKIVQALNTGKHLRFDTVLSLTVTFGTKFLSFIHTTYITALHRPFATIKDPAFYLSRATTLRLSKQHLNDLTYALQNPSPTDPFAPLLLLLDDPPFRPQAQHALLHQSHELYRSDNKDSRAVILATLRGFFSVAEQNMKKGRFVDRMLMVPAMVFAHLDATERCGVGSEEYGRYMQGVGNAARGCSGG